MVTLPSRALSTHHTSISIHHVYNKLQHIIKLLLHYVHTHKHLVIKRIYTLFKRIIYALDYLLAPRLGLKIIIRHTIALCVLWNTHVIWRLFLRRPFYSLIKFIQSFFISHDKLQRMNELHGIMQNAKTFDEWALAACELDKLEGKFKWKDQSYSDVYDYRRILCELQNFRALVDKQDIRGIMSYARARLQRNLVGINDRRLYTVLRSGTKRLIEEYISEVVRALQLVSIVQTDDITSAEKLAFFNETRHAFGRSALLLSGGATNALFHTGVVRALFENQLLPRVFSGSSGGSIICAMLGTRTDDELQLFLNPEANAVNFNFFPPQAGSLMRRIKRFWNRGVVLDINILGACIEANVPPLTFAEAYDRTGRIINIVVSPAYSHGNQDNNRICNYLTTPNVLVSSAALASCAIPGVYEPVELLAKNEHGEICPYLEGQVAVKWEDGSVQADLPMTRLSELFNVNNYIVSQVNPHVVVAGVRVLLADANRRSCAVVLGVLCDCGITMTAPFISSAWRIGGHYDSLIRNPVSKLIQFLALQLKDTVLHLWQLGVLPMHVSLKDVLDQQYVGDVTIVPNLSLEDFRLLLVNPTKERYARCQRQTELQTWRMMATIRGLLEVEMTLDESVRRMRGILILEELQNQKTIASMKMSKIRSWSVDEFEAAQNGVDEDECEDECDECLRECDQCSNSDDEELGNEMNGHGLKQNGSHRKHSRVRKVQNASQSTNAIDQQLYSSSPESSEAEESSSSKSTDITRTNGSPNVMQRRAVTDNSQTVMEHAKRPENVHTGRKVKQHPHHHRRHECEHTRRGRDNIVADTEALATHRDLQQYANTQPHAYPTLDSKPSLARQRSASPPANVQAHRHDINNAIDTLQRTASRAELMRSSPRLSQLLLNTPGMDFQNRQSAIVSGSTTPPVARQHSDPMPLLQRQTSPSLIPSFRHVPPRISENDLQRIVSTDSLDDTKSHAECVHPPPATSPAASTSPSARRRQASAASPRQHNDMSPYSSAVYSPVAPPQHQRRSSNWSQTSNTSSAYPQTLLERQPSDYFSTIRRPSVNDEALALQMNNLRNEQYSRRPSAASASASSAPYVHTQTLSSRVGGVNSKSHDSTGDRDDELSEHANVRRAVSAYDNNKQRHRHHHRDQTAKHTHTGQPYPELSKVNVKSNINISSAASPTSRTPLLFNSRPQSVRRMLSDSPTNSSTQRYTQFPSTSRTFSLKSLHRTPTEISNSASQTRLSDTSSTPLSPIVLQRGTSDITNASNMRNEAINGEKHDNQMQFRNQNERQADAGSQSHGETLTGVTSSALPRTLSLPNAISQYEFLSDLQTMP